MKGLSFLGASVTVLLAASCTTAPDAPLRTDGGTPDWAALRIQASRIDHPLLPPIALDERDGLSPDEIAILAVLHNPSLDTLRDQQGLADAQLLQAGLLPNPRLSLDMTRPVGGNTDGTVNGFGMGLDWDVAALISRSSRQEAAEIHTNSIALDVAWAEWQVAQAARCSAVKLAIRNQRLALTRQMEALAEQRYQYMQQQVVKGFIAAQDLAPARTLWQQARIDRLQTQAALEKERQQLNRLVGVPAEETIPVIAELDSPETPPPSTAVLLQNIETRRLDLLALKLGYKSQNARIRAAVRSRFPSINIGWNTGKDTDGVKTIGVGVSIDLPFFDQNQGVLAEEQATRQLLLDEYRERCFTASADIVRLESELAAACSQANLLRQMIGSASRQTDGLQEAVANGQANLTDYYSALTERYNEEIQLTDLGIRMIDLRNALQIAAGCFDLTALKQSPSEEEAPK